MMLIAFILFSTEIGGDWLWTGALCKTRNSYTGWAIMASPASWSRLDFGSLNMLIQTFDREGCRSDNALDSCSGGAQF
jgi:hypothetical protein